MTIEKAVQNFIKTKMSKFLNPKDCFIYNEFSLQHELGIHLREVLGDSYKIQFERNILDISEQYFKNKSAISLCKKEMDIYIRHGNDHYAIELKFPLKEQSAKEVRLYSFIEDIYFMKQVKNLGFKQTFVFTLVNDAGYYTKSDAKGKEVYKIFRQPTVFIGKNEIKKINKDIEEHNEECKNKYKLFPSLATTQTFNWQTIPGLEKTVYRCYFHSIE